MGQFLYLVIRVSSDSLVRDNKLIFYHFILFAEGFAVYIAAVAKIQTSKLQTSDLENSDLETSDFENSDLETSDPLQNDWARFPYNPIHLLCIQFFV